MLAVYLRSGISEMPRHIWEVDISEKLKSQMCLGIIEIKFLSYAYFSNIPGDRAKLGRQPLRVCQNRVSYLHSLELWTLPRSWLLAVTELASLACRPAGGPVHGAYITFLKFAYFVRHTWLYKMSYLPLKIFWELWFPWSENSIWAKILEF